MEVLYKDLSLVIYSLACIYRPCMCMVYR